VKEESDEVISEVLAADKAERESPHDFNRRIDRSVGAKRGAHPEGKDSD